MRVKFLDGSGGLGPSLAQQRLENSLRDRPHDRDRDAVARDLFRAAVVRVGSL